MYFFNIKLLQRAAIMSRSCGVETDTRLCFCGAVVLKLFELWAGSVMGKNLVYSPQTMDCLG